MSHPGYAPNYGAPAPVPSPMDPRTQEQTLKERKESFSQASLKLKRSMSTPNVRPRQANTSDPSQSGLAGDKKRNKLGYHRTSVACAPAHLVLMERSSRTLPPTENPLHSIARDWREPMHQLHQAEEGMQLLPGGPAAAATGDRTTPQGAVTGFVWAQGGFCFVFSRHGRWAVS
ncbi:hypothetical protein ColLi_00714 [Colletotrichum liriopes]|uniref:Uncharacterized protein n=1 Tax=Colletotrichum liriopes TaxID=708192 RepID=A0AA37LMJ6_9PEZI|nr:hypothetical protein ColLi_00714 [Colletotrichum liriopes]